MYIIFFWKLPHIESFYNNLYGYRTFASSVIVIVLSKYLCSGDDGCKLSNKFVNVVLSKIKSWLKAKYLKALVSRYSLPHFRGYSSDHIGTILK